MCQLLVSERLPHLTSECGFFAIQFRLQFLDGFPTAQQLKAPTQARHPWHNGILELQKLTFQHLVQHSESSRLSPQNSTIPWPLPGETNLRCMDKLLPSQNPPAQIRPLLQCVRSRGAAPAFGIWTWHWKIPVSNRRYILKWWSFHCHISFRGYMFGLTFIALKSVLDLYLVTTLPPVCHLWVFEHQKNHQAGLISRIAIPKCYGHGGTRLKILRQLKLPNWSTQKFRKHLCDYVSKKQKLIVILQHL